jgi:hypothetical protein
MASTARRLLLALVVIVTAAAVRAEPIGTVARQEGAVVALRHGQPLALTIGSELLVGDEIRTGAVSKLLLTTTAGLEVMIGPDSSLVLAGFDHDPAGQRLDALFALVRGIVRLVGEALPGTRAVRVETDAAVASVRSTDWLVEQGPDGTAVFVLAGRVVVAGRIGDEVVLGPGDGTDVAPGAPPSEPRQWGAARIAGVLARTTFGP